MESEPFGGVLCRIATSEMSRGAALQGGAGLAATLGLAGLHAAAQEATPAPAGPVALKVGPDGAVYVAAPALGSIEPDGYILRIDVSAKGPFDVREVAATAGGRDFSPQHQDYFGDMTPAAETTVVATPTAAAATPEAPVAATKVVSLEAGNFYFKPNEVTIPANTPVKFDIKNVAQIPHNFSIDALKVSVEIQPGQTSSVTIDAPAGSYEFYCNLPGHKADGMYGTLTVS